LRTLSSPETRIASTTRPGASVSRTNVSSSGYSKAYVRSNAPTSTSGADTTIRVYKSGTTETHSYLKFVALEHRGDMWPQALPYGEQRRLEIARALAMEPALLLLDEPAAGINPQETQELNALIRRIVALGKTVLLIEHDMKMVMDIADRITVINYGHKIAEGTPREIQTNRDVIEAYLGEEE